MWKKWEKGLRDFERWSVVTRATLYFGQTVHSGEATVSAKPDQELIEIGVVTQRATAMAASVQNANQTDAVLADLRRLLSGSGILPPLSRCKPEGFAGRALTVWSRCNLI